MPNVSSSKRTFLDTNILVYTDDVAALKKRHTAIELVKQHRRQNSGVLSVQVLQEYFATVTRKFKLPAEIAQRKIRTLARLHVVSPTADDILSAIDLHRLHHVSIWDALILRMASQSGCTVLLTEDLHHGQVIDDVRIVNPFL